MEPFITMLFLTLVSSMSVDIAYDDTDIVDGFVSTDRGFLIFDEFQATNNPNRVWGYMDSGDAFYLLVLEDKILLKIWQDDRTIRFIEPIV